MGNTKGKVTVDKYNEGMMVKIMFNNGYSIEDISKMIDKPEREVKALYDMANRLMTKNKKDVEEVKKVRDYLAGLGKMYLKDQAKLDEKKVANLLGVNEKTVTAVYNHIDKKNQQK